MPDIENPQTYAEWYWNVSVEAKITEQERYEKELTPITSSLIDDLNIKEFLPPALLSLFTSLQAPKAPALAKIMSGFAEGMAQNVSGKALDHALMDFNYKMAEWFGDLRIDFPTASTLLMRKKITDDLFNARAKSAGYKEAESAAAYDALRPYPEVLDLIQWARYNGYYDNVKETVWKKFDLAVDDFDLWNWLSWLKLSTEQAQQLFVRGRLSEIELTKELGQLGWQTPDREHIQDLAYEIPNPMLLMQGNLVMQSPFDAIKRDIQQAGIHPNYIDKYYNGILTKPSSQDIIAYELRRDTNLLNLSNELSKIGIHPNYHNLYKELAYPIPPVQDIITMAVREAFTPEIANRFGQYEGLPAPYVEWVQKKGLTQEWAERYWAAHWSLPSVQQGFEMLHRGIIDRDTLELLMRALDIMPFWRDKLIQMSYRPLTRVDVRRMYQVGTLDEQGVKKAYKDVGYSEANSDLMTDFTLKYVRNSLSRFSSTDVINAYKSRFLDEGQARNILRDLGIKEVEINNIIKTATYKREWQYKKEQTDAIENLYKKGRMDEGRTRGELSKLGYPSDHITTLLNQWLLKSEEERVATWTTAQTLGFLKKQLISRERAGQELQLLGYSAERIEVYLRSTEV
jgi:hypothetical protein